MNTAKQRRTIVGLRLAIGVGGMLAPRLLGRLFGVKEIPDVLPYVMRLFAVRDAIMAYQLYQASDDELEEVYRQGIVVDSIDVISALAAYANGDISGRTFVMGGGTAAGVAALAYVTRPGFAKAPTEVS